MAAQAGMRYTGKVKSFSLQNNFGFIGCPKISEELGQDVYVHGKSIEFSGLDPTQLQDGQMVSFELFISTSGRPQANSIKIITPSTTSGKSKNGGAGKGPPHALKGSWSAGGVSPKGKWSPKGGLAPKGGGNSKGKKVAPVSTPPSSGKGPASGGGKSWSAKETSAGKSWSAKEKGGAAKSPTPPTVDESAVVEALRNVAGDNCTAKVTSDFASDGTPMINLSLSTVNSLLLAAGHEVVEGSQEVPDDTEGLAGYDGGKVEGPWFTGTIKEYFPDQAYGSIDSDAFKKSFGDKDLFIHADHLDPEGNGTLIAQEGEEVMFPLVEDEEGNAWAWAPIIRKNRDFLGTVVQWGSSHGYIRCETLWPIFEENVYVHANAAEYGGCSTKNGSPIVFNLHINKDGKPQASSPRPPGLDQNSLPGANKWGPPERSWPAAKKRKVEEAPSQEQEQQYSGHLKSFSVEKGFGFIECPELKEQYGRDVYLHSTEATNIGTEVGQPVTFQLHINAAGNPQASNVQMADA